MMDLERFLNALGDFLSNMAENSVEALTALWHREVGWAVNMTAPRCCCPVNGARSPPGFTKELQMVK